jgi:hypothetical protein
MQIRERSKMTQLVRTIYDETKKRGVEKMIGSFPTGSLSISQDLADLLTEKEAEQLKSFFKECSDKADERDKAFALEYCATRLKRFREALSASEKGALTVEQANAMWAELDATRSALRKAGYAKPKPE